LFEIDARLAAKTKNEIVIGDGEMVASLQTQTQQKKKRKGFFKENGKGNET